MSKVRVDFFKPSGKWYITEYIEWVDVRNDIIAAFAQSLFTHLKTDNELRLDGMVAVCLEPNTEFSYPIMMRVDDVSCHVQINESYDKSLEHEDAGTIVTEG